MKYVSGCLYDASAERNARFQSAQKKRVFVFVVAPGARPNARAGAVRPSPSQTRAAVAKGVRPERKALAGPCKGAACVPVAGPGRREDHRPKTPFMSNDHRPVRETFGSALPL